MNVAIILAAGGSQRMGQLKQLLAFGPRTILECVIDAVDSPRVHRIRVVLGCQSELIAPRLAATRAEVVVNLDWSRGMFSSVQAGLRQLPPDSRAVVVALGDQPRLQRATVERLLDEFETRGHPILVPLHHGQPGHPLLFSARYAPEILAMDGSSNLKRFLAKHAEDIARLAVPDDGVLVDIDDPSTYRQELERLDKQPGQAP